MFPVIYEFSLVSEADECVFVIGFSGIFNNVVHIFAFIVIASVYSNETLVYAK